MRVKSACVFCVTVCLAMHVSGASLLRVTAHGGAVNRILKVTSRSSQLRANLLSLKGGQDAKVEERGMDLKEFEKTVTEGGMDLAEFRKKALLKCVEEKLISSPEELETPDAGGWRPLQLAAKAERGDHVALLAAAGADMDSQTLGGVTALLVASFAGNPQMVRALLMAGANPDFQDLKEGRTALLMASAGGSAEVVLALLERGAQVDKPDTEGRTALWAAARFGNLAVVEALLKAGADPLAGGEEKAMDCVCKSIKDDDERTQDKAAIQELLELAADESVQKKAKQNGEEK